MCRNDKSRVDPKWKTQQRWFSKRMGALFQLKKSSKRIILEKHASGRFLNSTLRGSDEPGDNNQVAVALVLIPFDKNKWETGNQVWFG